MGDHEFSGTGKLNLVVKGLGAVLITGAVTFYGVYSERQQFEIAEKNRRAQILVQTVSTRETAASDMRARMFDTLVQHYFGNPGDDASRVAILEMLGHNFEEDLNLKPLFVRLDAELAAKGSEQRQTLRMAARSVANNELEKIVAAGGKVCQLDFSVGDTHVSKCINPIAVTLLQVQNDRVTVKTGPAPLDEKVLTYFDLPMVNNRTLGELKYALVLSSTDPQAGKAVLDIVQLPTTYYSVENRLRVDQIITDLTVQNY
jgi:hypothetical protein